MPEKIFRLSVVFSAITTIAASCCTLPSVPGTPNFAAYQHARTLSLQVLCPDGAAYIGSAAAIGGTYAITAAHVVHCGPEDDQPAILIWTDDENQKSIPAIVREVDARNDLAIVEIATLSTPRVAIARSGALGDSVAIVAANPIRSRTVGEILPAKPVPRDHKGGHTHVSAIADQGNSGGGCWRGAELFGVVTHTRICTNGQFCGAMITTLHNKINWLGDKPQLTKRNE